MTSHSLNTYCDVTHCMNGLWIFITKLESPKGDSQTWSSPPRNNGACVIIQREHMDVCEMTVKRTRLCYWIARPAKPGVQSSNTSRVRFTVISHTPMRSRFYHTHFTCKRNWDDFCLVDLIYFALHIFQIRNLLHCVDESWWNMPFKETRLVDGVADDAVAMLLWRHTVWIRIVTSHNAWMGYEYSIQNLNRPCQGRFTNMILTPSKQWGVCDNVYIDMNFTETEILSFSVMKLSSPAAPLPCLKLTCTFPWSRWEFPSSFPIPFRPLSASNRASRPQTPPRCCQSYRIRPPHRHHTGCTGRYDPHLVFRLS